MAFMRKLGIVCLLCFFVSCDWFSTREVKTQKLVEKELQAIDWNDVDQYPLFDDCDETVSKSAQRECFENTLLLHFSMTLQDFEFVLDKDIDESIYVDFLVDKDGGMTVLDIEEHGVLKEQIPEFNAIITQSFKSVPRVEPALKRGIPVNAKFRIPLVFNAK